MTAYLGEAPHEHNSQTDNVRDCRLYYFMDNLSLNPSGPDINGISFWRFWLASFGVTDERECDFLDLAVTMEGYSILGFEYGMSLNDAHIQAQVLMEHEGIEVVQFTDNATQNASTSDGFYIWFTYDGCEYMVHLFCPRGETSVESVVLRAKGDKDIGNDIWMG